MSKLTNMTRPHRGVEALIFTTKETGSRLSIVQRSLIFVEADLNQYTLIR